MATFGRMRDGSYPESEVYDSASVVPIRTRSELSSDSDSAYDSASLASVASVSRPLSHVITNSILLSWIRLAPT